MLVGDLKGWNHGPRPFNEQLDRLVPQQVFKGW